MKKTRWFSAKKHKPVRVGAYEFYDTLWGLTGMAHWDGEHWTNGECIWNTYDGDKWRGLLACDVRRVGNEAKDRR